ncbi:hypothetical protein B0H16DRAFT_1477153 [Mycena metata]|uniref:Uncharacterized protein n=1 Tax=Mycena metata TaxID=1033252 RepID=A0AAD7HAI7_9AGAR|nr:hypothetical protein B0H16DRAFT_1477153 [Mycena metata]
MPPRGRKAHGGRNISGLRNQKSKNSQHLGSENNTDTEGKPTPDKPVQDSLPEGDTYGSGPEDDCWLYDQRCTNLANIFANSDGEQDLPDDNEWEEVDDFEWDNSDPLLNDDALQTRLSTYAVAMDDDCADEDWVPPEVAKKLRKRKREQKDRAPTYATGPVAANKASRTLREPKWRNRMKGQKKLNKWATQDDEETQTRPVKAARTEASSSTTQYINLNSDSEEDFEIGGNDHSDIDMDVPNVADPQVELGTVDLSPAHSSVPSPVPSSAASSTQVSPLSTRPPTPEPAMAIGGDGITFEEEWEAELDEQVQAGPGPSFTKRSCSIAMCPVPTDSRIAILTWTEIRDLVDKKLRAAKKSHTPLAQVNQLLIIRNFATLSLKGFGCIQASVEIARQWHKDKGVHFARRVRAFSSAILKIFKISPERREGVHAILDPFFQKRVFGVQPGPGLKHSQWEASHLKYEELMTKYEGPDLEKVAPKLKEGEKEIIALFHDECCFHANDYKAKAWLQEGQTILQKKGRGRLIHVSDFITEVSGHLIIRDPAGKILKDARKVIFPGSNGDPWWDTKQLLEQVDNVITIFEKAHPGCQALFML